MSESTRRPATSEPARGWVLYDGSCAFCTNQAQWIEPWAAKRGYALAPFQAPWVMDRLGLAEGEVPEEMMALLPGGGVLGGIDAFGELARRVWWSWPFFLLTRIPGPRQVLAFGYREFARRRHCFGGACSLPGAPPPA